MKGRPDGWSSESPTTTHVGTVGDSTTPGGLTSPGAEMPLTIPGSQADVTVTQPTVTRKECPSKGTCAHEHQLNVSHIFTLL